MNIEQIINFYNEPKPIKEILFDQAATIKDI